jgi:hypothetical protein
VAASDASRARLRVAHSRFGSTAVVEDFSENREKMS